MQDVSPFGLLLDRYDHLNFLWTLLIQHTPEEVFLH